MHRKTHAAILKNRQRNRYFPINLENFFRTSVSRVPLLDSLKFLGCDTAVQRYLCISKHKVLK